MHDLVLIHGWGMNAAVWQPLLQPLSARFRLHRLELPGHGEQPFAGERSLRQWAETLLAQAPEQACWLGWSLGGQVALQAALLAPQRVRALLLCASVPHFTRSEDWPNALPVGTLSQFAEQLKQDYHATLGRFLALQVRGSEQGRAVLRQLQQGLRQRPEADPEALDVGLQLLRNSDLRDPLNEIRCPV